MYTYESWCILFNRYLLEAVEHYGDKPIVASKWPFDWNPKHHAYSWRHAYDQDGYSNCFGALDPRATRVRLRFVRDGYEDMTDADRYTHDRNQESDDDVRCSDSLDMLEYP